MLPVALPSLGATTSRAAGGFIAAGRAHLFDHLSGPQARQRSGRRLECEFCSLAPVVLRHGPTMTKETRPCPPSRLPEMFAAKRGKFSP